MQGDLLQQLLCPEKNYYNLAVLENPQRVKLKNPHQMACCSCLERLRSIRAPWRARRVNMVMPCRPQASARSRKSCSNLALSAIPNNSLAKGVWRGRQNNLQKAGLPRGNQLSLDPGGKSWRQACSMEATLGAPGNVNLGSRQTQLGLLNPERPRGSLFVLCDQKLCGAQSLQTSPPPGV